MPYRKGQELPFIRGDGDASGTVNIADVINLLDYLFGDGGPVLFRQQPNEKRRHLFRSVLASDREEPVARIVQILGRQRQQTTLQIWMVRQQCFEAIARKATQHNIRDALRRFVVFSGEEITEAVCFGKQCHNLLASIGERAGQLDRPRDDHGEQLADVILVDNLIASHEMAMPHHAAHETEFVRGQATADTVRARRTRSASAGQS